MRIACINYEPVSTYRNQGWSCDRLGRYYNPANVAKEVCVFAYRDHEWRVSADVRVSGYESFNDLQKKCREFKPDVIRCYEACQPNCNYALMVAVSLGVPSYLSFHDGRLRYNDQLAKFTVVTAYTETLAESATRRLRRPVELQLNGIDSGLFRPKDPVSVDRRIAEARHRIFTVMRADPVKNVDTVLEATAILSKRVDSVAHVLAGPGSEAIPFDGIHLGLGPTSEQVIVDYLNWCSCFLQVQLVGDVGMAATEALMVGRPVVATGGNTGNARHHIDDSNGILIPIDKVRDAAFIADALYACLKRQYDYASIRKTAVAVYDEHSLRSREAGRYTRLVGRDRAEHAGRCRKVAAGLTSQVRLLHLRAALAIDARWPRFSPNQTNHD